MKEYLETSRGLMNKYELEHSGELWSPIDTKDLKIIVMDTKELLKRAESREKSFNFISSYFRDPMNTFASATKNNGGHQTPKQRVNHAYNASGRFPRRKEQNQR